MFESVKQGERTSGAVYFTSLLVSLVVHATVICLLVVVPLVFFNVLQAQDVLTFLIEPPTPPPAPPPPAPPVAAHAGQQGLIKTDYGDPPKEIPNGIPPVDDSDPQPFNASLAVAAIPGAVGVNHGEGVWNTASILKANTVADPGEPKRPTVSPAPIRVGALEQSKLIYKVNPPYPVLAVKARVQGNVILEAEVDEEGNVAAVKVLSGHALLVDAAVQAVKQWRYSPTILNGEPVPVIATVTVVFRLN